MTTQNRQKSTARRKIHNFYVVLYCEDLLCCIDECVVEECKLPQVPSFIDVDIEFLIQNEGFNLLIKGLVCVLIFYLSGTSAIQSTISVKVLSILRGDVIVQT